MICDHCKQYPYDAHLCCRKEEEESVIRGNSFWLLTVIRGNSPGYRGYCYTCGQTRGCSCFWK